MKKWYKDWKFEGIRKAIDELEAGIAELEQTLMDEVGEIQKVEYIGNMLGGYSNDFEKWRCNYSNYSYMKPNYKTVAANSRKEIEKVWEEVQEKHKINEPAMENNRKVIEKIHRFMDQVGIAKSRTEWKYKTSRSRNKTELKITAGYIGDMNYYITTDDGFDNVKRRYEDFKERIDKYERDCANAEAELQRIKEAEQKKEQAELARAALVVKYSLDYSTGWSEILDHLLQQDKYLRLAHYLMMNRNDWSDGSWYAQMGLEGFECEKGNTFDQAIEKELWPLVNDWDMDGRVFRDCKYNYNVIFEQADEGLYKDYEIAYNNSVGELY